MNEYKGFSLFNDIDDAALRNRNRAVILANIAESQLDKVTKRIKAGGAALILRYFSLVPEADREAVKSDFEQHMKERGFLAKA
jgi:hypothetical protein